MDNKLKITRIQAIGLFVVVTLLGIFLVINFLKGQNLFNKRTIVYTTFQNVEGLTATGPVYIRGLKVGTVESIKFNTLEDSFIVKLSVKSDYIIPKNSIAEIYSADILGSKSIRINLGNSNFHIQKNDTIVGKCEPDMMSMITKDIIPIKEQLTQIMTNVNILLVNVNTLIDTTTVVNMQQSISNLNATLANTKKLTTSFNGFIPEIEEILKNVNSLTSVLANSSGDINNSLKNINQITTQLSEADIKSTIDNLNQLIEKVKDPDGTIGKLLTTDSLHNSVDSLINNLNDLVQRISDNPKKYIKISVF